MFKRTSHLEGYINWRKELGDANESEDAIYQTLSFGSLIFQKSFL